MSPAHQESPGQVQNFIKWSHGSYKSDISEPCRTPSSDMCSSYAWWRGHARLRNIAFVTMIWSPNKAPVLEILDVLVIYFSLWMSLSLVSSQWLLHQPLSEMCALGILYLISPLHFHISQWQRPPNLIQMPLYHSMLSLWKAQTGRRFHHLLTFILQSGKRNKTICNHIAPCLYLEPGLTSRKLTVGGGPFLRNAFKVGMHFTVSRNYVTTSSLFPRVSSQPDIFRRWSTYTYIYFLEQTFIYFNLWTYGEIATLYEFNICSTCTVWHALHLILFLTFFKTFCTSIFMIIFFKFHLLHLRMFQRTYCF